MLKSNITKLVVGIIISAVFLYLAFRQVDLEKVADAIKKAEYWYLLPGSVFLFLSLWIRAYRWGVFFKPIKQMKMNNLFSALMIGYMANTVFPFKLGEFLRAHSIGKMENFSKVTSLATVVVERILDVIFLLVLLGIALLFQPFTGYEYVKSGGLLMFLVATVAILFLIFLVIRTEAALKFYEKVTRMLPEKLRDAGRAILNSLTEGLLVLKKPEYYLVTAITSVAIWFCYVALIVIFIFAFSLQDEIINGGVGKIFVAGITVLVMSGLSVSVPSSPGYIGTYHYLVSQGLIIYGVQPSEALSFAVVTHIFGIFPPAILGMYYFLRQHISFHDALEKESLPEES